MGMVNWRKAEDREYIDLLFEGIKTAQVGSDVRTGRIRPNSIYGRQEEDDMDVMVAKSRNMARMKRVQSGAHPG